MNALTNNGPMEAHEYEIFVRSCQNTLAALPEISSATASLYNDLIRSTQGISKRAEASRKALKEPHLNAGRKLDESFSVVSSAFMDVVSSAKSTLQEHLVVERLRADEAARSARFEADRASEISAALADDEFIGESVRADADKKQKASDRLAFSAHNAGRVGSMTGEARTSSLRAYRIATIADSKKAAIHFCNNTNVKIAIQKAASALLRASKGNQVDIPGIEITIEERVS